MAQNPQNDCLCARCMKKETSCIRALAAGTVDFQQVTDGFHECVKVGETDLLLVNPRTKISAVYY